MFMFVSQLLSVLLRSDRIYERSKSRLRLQDASVLGGNSVGMYPGLIAMLQDQQLSMEVTAMLLDQILSTGWYLWLAALFRPHACGAFFCCVNYILNNQDLKKLCHVLLGKLNIHVPPQSLQKCYPFCDCTYWWSISPFLAEVWST
jgi:hypothetical protein